MKLLRSLRRDESGFAYTAATALAAMITIAIVWNILGPSLETKVFGYSENQMKEDGTWESFKDTHALILFIWRVWPIFLLLAMIIYLLTGSQRQAQATGYWRG